METFVQNKAQLVYAEAYISDMTSLKNIFCRRRPSKS